MLAPDTGEKQKNPEKTLGEKGWNPATKPQPISISSFITVPPLVGGRERSHQCAVPAVWKILIM